MQRVMEDTANSIVADRYGDLEELVFFLILSPSRIRIME